LYTRNSIDAHLSDDDPVREFLPAAWVRVCTVIGADFAPLLSKVLPPLLEKAQISPTVHIIEEEDMESEEYSQGWYFYDVHGKKIAIHTDSLEEKADAIESIGYYARTLGATLAPYAEQIMDLLLPALKFDYFARAQIEAAKNIPSLLLCLKQGNSRKL